MRVLAVYVAGVALLGACFLGALSLGWIGPGAPVMSQAALGQVILFFVVLNVITSLSDVRLPRGEAHASVDFAADYAAILIAGPAVGAWISALGSPIAFLVLSSAMRRGRSGQSGAAVEPSPGPPTWLRVLFDSAQHALAAGLAGLAYLALGGTVIAFSATGKMPINLGALLAAAVVYLLVNSVLVSVAVSLFTRSPFWSTWLVNSRFVAPPLLALAPFGLLMAMIYQLVHLQVSHQSFVLPHLLPLALFIVPLLWARHTFAAYTDQRQLYLDTVDVLTRALDSVYHGAPTGPHATMPIGQHSRTVAHTALGIAQHLGFPDTQREALSLAAQLHDIGKCLLDLEELLDKPGKLTSEEWVEMKKHPVAGAEIVSEMEFHPGISHWVRHHHERMDGGGYPDGLPGPQIAVGARIICVADAYTALTEPRPYRRALSPLEALDILWEASETQFDPKVVQALQQSLISAQVIDESEVRQIFAIAGGKEASAVVGQ